MTETGERSPATPRRSSAVRRGQEYSGERDMERFWAEVAPRREPSNRRWYIPVLLALVVLSVPWYFGAGSVGAVVAGLPVWVWMTIACTLGVACVTAWGALRLWGDEEEGNQGAEPGAAPGKPEE